MAKTTRRPASNGSKAVACVRKCGAEIQPYAGREVALSKYAHHPGQCGDVAEHEATVRAAAGEQGTLFAWRCERTEGHSGMPAPEICRESGTDRAAFTAHMRDVHGEPDHKPAYPVPVKLRKRPPAAPRVAPLVPPFKYLTWAETHVFPAMCDCGHDINRHEVRHGIGGQAYSCRTCEGCQGRYYGDFARRESITAERRGQFWSNADGANCVWVLPLAPAPWEPQDRTPAPVRLYLCGDGSVTTDWSEARRARREVKRRTSRAAA
jgi:hypothetical protein